MMTHASDWAHWPDEQRRQRLAAYRARYLSWKLGRTVTPMSMNPGDHWWHLPLVFADTWEPI